MTPVHPLPTLDQPAVYRIEVVGRLSADWSEHFGGMQITTRPNEDGQVTILTGKVVDQASLHGLLRAIRDLGLPLLLVEFIKS